MGWGCTGNVPEHGVGLIQDVLLDDAQGVFVGYLVQGACARVCLQQSVMRRNKCCRSMSTKAVAQDDQPTFCIFLNALR